VRRIGGFALFTVGWMLIFLAPLLRFYATPRIEKAPTDVYDNTVSIGSGRIFSAKTFSVQGPLPLRHDSIAKGNPKASTHDVAVISIFGKTVETVTGGAIDYAFDVYAMDRRTGYAVHCCGENPRAEGVTLKFPFGTGKITYPFYDSTAHKAFPARYLREERLEGLDTFVFQSDVPQTFLQNMFLPGFVAGLPTEPNVQVSRWYRAQTTLWVEPVTGAIIKGAQHAVQWTTTKGEFITTLADTNFVNNQASVRHTADEVRGNLDQLILVRFWLPILGPVVGAAFIVIGLILVLGSPQGTTRRTAPFEDMAPAPMP
jgi:Porin PorA